MEKSPLSLSPSEIKCFHDQGFLGPYDAFGADEMEALRTTIVDRVLTTPASHSPYPTHCRHFDSAAVWKLCSAPAVIDRMSSLYGSDLLLWASAFFDKAPARPGQEEEYPWHQDLYNWRLEPMLNISAWMAITPATVENGCVEVVPGSHKRLVARTKNTDQKYSFRFAGSAADPDDVDEGNARPMELQPGQFFLFNERTLHRSRVNRSQHRRIGLSIRVTTPIVKSYEDWPCMHLRGEDPMGFNDYADIPNGEPDVRWQDNLLRSDEFAFDRPVPGLGWHLPERDGERCFAWIGPEPEAWVDLLPTTNSNRLVRCDVLHRISDKSLEQVEIRVNDHPIDIRQSQGEGVTVLEGMMPDQIPIGSERVRITVRVPNLIRPCDVNASSGDVRMLGLGITRIALSSPV